MQVGGYFSLKPPCVYRANICPTSAKRKHTSRKTTFVHEQQIFQKKNTLSFCWNYGLIAALQKEYLKCKLVRSGPAHWGQLCRQDQLSFVLTWCFPPCPDSLQGHPSNTHYLHSARKVEIIRLTQFTDPWRKHFQHSTGQSFNYQTVCKSDDRANALLRGYLSKPAFQQRQPLGLGLWPACQWLSVYRRLLCPPLVFQPVSETENGNVCGEKE